MKIIGVILLVFAVLNFITAIIAAGNGVLEVAWQKIDAAVLLGVIGGVFYFFGKKKALNKKDDANY